MIVAAGEGNRRVVAVPLRLKRSDLIFSLKLKFRWSRTDKPR